MGTLHEQAKGICRVTVLTLHNWILFILVQNLSWFESRNGKPFLQGLQAPSGAYQERHLWLQQYNNLFLLLFLHLFVLLGQAHSQNLEEQSQEKTHQSLDLNCPARPTNSQRLTSSCDCSDSLRTGLVWGVGGSNSLLWKFSSIALVFSTNQKFSYLRSSLHTHVWGDWKWGLYLKMSENMEWWNFCICCLTSI